MWVKTAGTALALVLALARSATALDCERVRALSTEGKRPSEIARELGITTPDVQACLAGAVDETKPARERRTGLPVLPQLPAGDAALPRQPNQ